MCRFALYLGPPTRIANLVTQPVNSIIHQSFHSHEGIEPLNGDGFGIAWYAPELSDEPAVFKDLTPAWSNANLHNLAPVTRSSCMLAHVRAATPGLPVTRLNCHPFWWHRFAFMHNGVVGGFRGIVRQLQSRLSDDAFHQIQGSTDSEHLFALFTDHWRLRGGGDPLERMLTALLAAIAETEELKAAADIRIPSLLNLALTDGHRAVVTRYISPGAPPEKANSLYVHTGRRFVCEEGVARMVRAPAETHSVVIASEPLSRQESWRRVPPNHVVVVDEDLGAEVVPLDGAGGRTAP